jgi:hypothetical protein
LVYLIQDLSWGNDSSNNFERETYHGMTLYPADLLTRGIWPSKLVKTELSFNRPKFLYTDRTNWVAVFKPPSEIALEKPKFKSVLTAKIEDESPF